MKEFIEKYQDLLIGVLSGFDRVVLRGTLRPLSVPEGMLNFLYRIGVLLKDFGDYIQQTTTRLKQVSLAEAKRLNRPIQYLASSSEDKDKIAHKIMESDKIEKGLICVLSSVEPCMSFQLSRNKEKKKLQLERKWRKMRKGVSDIHQRVQVSQSSNDRYLDALAGLSRLRLSLRDPTFFLRKKKD